jgi:hypothetical protein
MAGISKLNIKFCGSHAGTSIGDDGSSQMGLFNKNKIKYERFGGFSPF